RRHAAGRDRGGGIDRHRLRRAETSLHAGAARGGARSPSPPKGLIMLEVNTFSISARCARTGMLGVAVSTAVPGVGGICPFVEPGVGAISTQSWVNPYLGIDGLPLLRAGKSAQDVLNELIDKDPGRDVRQLGIVDSKGASAAWSGKNCTSWFGHLTGPNYAVQGNMLVGETTIAAMAEAFTRTEALALADR